jgi:hypothetical protein
MSTHGSTFTWSEGFGEWKTTYQYPALCLAETCSRENDLKYAEELHTKQIARIDGRYWLLPSFFQNAYADDALSGTVIFSESCEFMGKEDSVDYSMADALLSCGAEAVVGYHNLVYSGYGRVFMRTFVEEMLLGATTDQAFAAAKRENGENHDVWYYKYYSYRPKDLDTATPYLRGDGQYSLYQ